ncbi:hypothetical protein KTE29_03705 [Burkholderia multivorans]|uniref:hypothetical protein n=1 Tax=Burkholderia multivorans TaxID=87883 RepID=UPI001C220EDA|nr:hypothetical protein [Burkholderia multivorans]MBU9144786.1 hypothetical protein [Burkholderia multivorans]MBU9446888.1 hypothetical protein [Burkholderia multivorans]
MPGKLTDTTLMQLYTLANRHGYQAFARHVKNLLAPTQQPSGEVTDTEQLATRFLQEEDSADLFTFNLQAEDGDGYTASKDTMKRLAELGVVQSLGFGRYGVTAFGMWLIEAEFSQKPRLPLRTRDEHNERENAGYKLYLKESAPGSIAWLNLTSDEQESWRRKACDAARAQGGES